MKANWFNTLHESLESENIAHLWDCTWSPIDYGETRRFTVETVLGEGEILGCHSKQAKYTHVSITRELNGKYERPIVYDL